MSNIILNNTSSLIFLTIVLIKVTFVTLDPSSFILEVNLDNVGKM